MAERLTKAGLRFVAQYVWRRRIFDFWLPREGIVIEVDGGSHLAAGKAWSDELADAECLLQGIVVLRVPNGDAEAAEAAVATAKGSETWAQRRARLGMRSRKRRARKGRETPAERDQRIRETAQRRERFFGSTGKGSRRSH
jgi:very-short-patch-repair endonuclease